MPQTNRELFKDVRSLRNSTVLEPVKRGGILGLQKSILFLRTLIRVGSVESEKSLKLLSAIATIFNRKY